MDGSRTPRSEMVSKIGKWANAPQQAGATRNHPVKGEVGHCVCAQTEIFLYSLMGDTKAYSQAMDGAYQGFFDNNIQADWVHIDDIDQYDLLYLPIPAMLSEQNSTG